VFKILDFIFTNFFLSFFYCTIHSKPIVLEIAGKIATPATSKVAKFYYLYLKMYFFRSAVKKKIQVFSLKYIVKRKSIEKEKKKKIH
jgi:hypothetical protein